MERKLKWRLGENDIVKYVPYQVGKETTPNRAWIYSGDGEVFVISIWQRTPNEKNNWVDIAYFEKDTPVRTMMRAARNAIRLGLDTGI